MMAGTLPGARFFAMVVLGAAFLVLYHHDASNRSVADATLKHHIIEYPATTFNQVLRPRDPASIAESEYDTPSDLKARQGDVYRSSQDSDDRAAADFAVPLPATPVALPLPTPPPSRSLISPPPPPPPPLSPLHPPPTPPPPRSLVSKPRAPEPLPFEESDAFGDFRGDFKGRSESRQKLQFAPLAEAAATGFTAEPTAVEDAAAPAKKPRRGRDLRARGMGGGGGDEGSVPASSEKYSRSCPAGKPVRITILTFAGAAAFSAHVLVQEPVVVTWCARLSAPPCRCRAA